MRTVRPCEVVESLPFLKFGEEIDITFVAEKLVKFLLIRSVEPATFPFSSGELGLI